MSPLVKGTSGADALCIEGVGGCEGRSLQLSQGLPSLHVQVAKETLPCLCRRRFLMRADCVRRRPFLQRRISGGFCSFSTALVVSGGKSSGQKQQMLSRTVDGTRLDGWMYCSKKQQNCKNKERNTCAHSRYCSRNQCGPKLLFFTVVQK